MQEQLRIAMNLQLVENRRKALLAELEATPRALAELQGKSQESEAAVAQAKAAIDGGRKEKRRLEGEIEAVKAKIGKYREQLMSVKTNKEYSALLHEIEECNGVVRGIEDRILELMEAEDKLTREVGAKDQALRQIKGELSAAEQTSAAAMGRVREALAEQDRERDKLRAALDKEILSHFDRVFSVRGGVSVVGVKGESCEGCRVRIRPQVLAEMRQHVRMHVCDNCKRILFYEPPVEEPAGTGAAGAKGAAVGA